MAKTKQEANNNGNVHPKRIFQKPSDILKAFEEYKAYVEIQAEKWLKVQYVGKDGQRVTDKNRPPLTMDGFEVFCNKNYGGVNHYFDNKDGYYEEFGTICRAIAKEIREDQIIGGMLGFYNPSITQRLNNLKENIEQTNNIKLDQITGMEIK